jgi:DNA-binding XRE family transcriptional regulator
MRTYAELAGAFATNLRACRQKLELDQSMLARRTGIARSTICHLEKGKVNPSLITAATLAGALGVTIDSLMRVPE